MRRRSGAARSRRIIAHAAAVPAARGRARRQPAPAPPPRDTGAQPQPPAPPANPPTAAGQPAPPPVDAPSRTPDSARPKPARAADLSGRAVLASYDAGRGQRYYLFGIDRVVRRAGRVLPHGAEAARRLVFDVPATHKFEVGRFREETMAFPPGVTVKDFSRRCRRATRTRSPARSRRGSRRIIQIVPVAERYQATSVGDCARRRRLVLRRARRSPACA